MSENQQGSGKLGANAEAEVDTELMAYTQETKQVPPKRNLDDMKIEQLYLLEVLVNSVEVQSEPSQFKDQEPPPPLCVRIKFIDFPCIEIGQEDFFGPDEESKHEAQVPGPNVPGTPANATPASATSKTPSLKVAKVPDKTSKTAPDSSDKNVKQTKSDKSVKSDKSSKLDSSKTGKKGVMKTPTKDSKSKRSATKLNSIDLSSGKSCLFPMLPLELIRQIQRLPISIHVFRKSAEEAIPIGQCKVRLGTQFEDAIIKAVYENDPLPVTTTLECDSRLNSVFGDQTGRISIFIRLSCFGATIVTQFQLRGQEHQEYIFKTSKKDNTIEAQKKKGFLYGIGPYKMENVVKPLVDRHDISPFKPIITDENTFPLGSLTKEGSLSSVPTKIIPWKKYVKECGCENLDEDWLSDYNQEHQNKNNRSFAQNISQPPNSRCPVSECDCCGTSSESQMPNKCPLADCDCYNNSRPERQNPMTNPQLNKLKKGRMNSGCCSVPNNFSEPRTETLRNTNTARNFNFTGYPRTNIPGNQFSIDKCDCYKDAISSRRRNPIESPGSFSQKIPSCLQNCSSDKKNSLVINKYTTKVQNVKQTQNSISDRSKNLQHDIDNCFFADLHVSQQMQYQDNATSCFSSMPQKQANPCCCKIGTNSRGEYFCYKREDDGGNVNMQSGTIKGAGNQLNQYNNIGDQHSLLNHCNISNQDKVVEQAGENTSQVTNNSEVQESHVEDPMQYGEGKRPSDKQAKYDPLGPGGDTNKSSESDSRKGFETKPPLKSGNELPKKVSDVRSEDSSKKIHKDKSISDKSTRSDSLAEKEAKRRRKKYYRSIYHYTAGMYPGINIGHRYCTRDFRLVPKTMGWLWNIGDSGDGLPMRRGWKPGAINRKIATMMKKGKKAGLTIEKEEVTPPVKSVKGFKRKRPNQTRSGNTASSTNLGDYSTGPQSPTLHIHKKDGAYFIAMNPIKTDSEEEEDERSPLMFKILPHEDEESTSSESSLEIEFTAPGAFRKKPIKPIMTEMDTQYSDPDSVIEILQPPAGKGKKGDKGEKPEKGAKKAETPPSSKGSEPKENKWDVDQPTQIAKTKK